jgi:hypothetical protein
MKVFAEDTIQILIWLYERKFTSKDEVTEFWNIYKKYMNGQENDLENKSDIQSRLLKELDKT